MEAINYITTYSTTSNLISSIKTISEDLSVVGLPPVIMFDEKNPAPTLVSLINTVWSLLQHRQNLVSSKCDLEKKISALSAELNYLKEKQKRIDTRLLDCEDCLIKEKKITLLTVEGRSQALQESKFLKKQVQELKLKLKSRELQFLHEVQKQQNKIAMLQESLRGNVCKGMNWEGPINHSVKYKLSDTTIQRKEDLYRKSICRLEDNVQTLVNENMELRKILSNVSNDLCHMLTPSKQLAS